jgi:hypothetical protein
MNNQYYEPNIYLLAAYTGEQRVTFNLCNYLPSIVHVSVGFPTNHVSPNSFDGRFLILICTLDPGWCYQKFATSLPTLKVSKRLSRHVTLSKSKEWNCCHGIGDDLTVNAPATLSEQGEQEMSIPHQAINAAMTHLLSPFPLLIQGAVELF